MSDFQTAREFAQFIKGLGFRAFVAGGPGGDGRRGYGIITDAEGSRVLSFGMEGDLGGNYGPPSRASGTGWRIRPDSGFRYYCTLDQHLGMYGASSKYEEI